MATHGGRRLGWFVAGGLLIAPLAAGAAAVAGLVSTVLTAAVLLAVGAGVGAMTLAAGFELEGLSPPRRDPMRGTRFAELRDRARLRASALTLVFLLLFTVMVLLGAVLRRVGLVSTPVPSALGRGAALVFAAAVTIAAAFAQFRALRMRQPRDRSDLTRVYVYALALSGFGLAVFGVVVAGGGARGPLLASDGLFLGLAGMALLAVAPFVGGGLPSPVSVYDVKDVRGYGPRQLTYTRSVVVPTFIAFSALFVVVFVFVTYGFGVAKLLRHAAGSVLASVVLMMLLLTLAVSLGAAFWLARVARPVAAYRARRADAATRRPFWILVLSVPLAAVLFGVAALIRQGGFLGVEPSLWVHAFAAGCCVLLGPYGFERAREARRVRLVEERLPELLRDLAASHRGGLDIPSALRLASGGDYGELSGEVQKMADQLSWDVPLDEVLHRFGERVRTPLVRRSVSLILEASANGGNTTEILLAVSADTRAIKSLESDRRLSMGLYAGVVHVCFLVFLVVTGVLYTRFVPEIVAAGERLAGAGAVQSLGFAPVSELAFRDFYFVAAVVQGIGNGIVAGIMGTGRWDLGLRHAFVMVAAAWLTFSALL